MARGAGPHDNILKDAGLRRTPVRTGVIEQLTKSGRPMSVPELLGKLKTVDSVTVYRTLATFVKKGMVHKVRSDDRSWLYAIGSRQKDSAHRHPHFVCETCGKVECLEKSNVPDSFLPGLKIDRNYSVRYAEVVVHGTCPTCPAGGRA